MKSISVALATYNGAQYLPDLLDSLAAQTHLPYELVVSDDNSSDSTIEVLESFQKRAPFQVHIIRNETQRGIIDNFAMAFEHTTGDVIAYCDQDDFWERNKLETCIPYFDDDEVVMVMHRSEIVDERLQSTGREIPLIGANDSDRAEFPATHEMTVGLGHQMLFSTELFRDYHWMFQRGFDALQPFAENYDDQFRFLAGMNGSIICLEQKLVKFRRHDQATSDAGVVAGDAASENNAGFLGKTSKSFYNIADSFVFVAEVLTKEVLGRMSAHREKLESYVDFIGQRAELYRRRGDIYASDSLFARMSILSWLVFHRAYRRRTKGGFGFKALAVDIFVSLFGLSGSQAIIRRMNKG